ncbi:hypothetical protein SLA2020_231650 [Shorea laevis]
MAFRLSNNLIGILNIITCLLSIPIIIAGVWLRNNGSTECARFLDMPVIAVGVFLMLVSLAGLFGACCRVNWLLWLYLVIMFLLIVIGLGFTIFAFVVTNEGAGKALSGKGYKEYRLGDYSNWLQKRVNNAKNWNKIKSCLFVSGVCYTFRDEYLHDSPQKFYQEHLTAIQSGCCKPSNDCGFTYVSPTNWTKTNTDYNNPDCDAWDNNPIDLCFNCNSCKAGLLDNIKGQWKKVAIVCIVFLIFLISTYTIGCCAFRNNRRDKHDYGWKA